MAKKEDTPSNADAVGNPPEVTDAIEKGKGTALVHWKDRMQAVKVVAQEAEKPQGGFISFKGGRMSFGDELIPGDALKCIIIDYRMENDLYKAKYVAGVVRSPDCFAIVRPDELQTPWRLMRPDEEGYEPDTLVSDSEDPQVEPGDGCADCPMNDWGSASLVGDKTPGARGKACKTSRRIMVLAADDCVSPEKIARAQVVTMIPPATSVDNFSTCMNQISKALDTAMFGAVVEISVKPHAKFLFQVHFKVIQQIQNEDILMALLARHEKEAAKFITYPKNSEREGGAPPPQSTKY